MFPDIKVKNYDYMDTVRLSSPTCEQLGIPNDDQRYHPNSVRNTLILVDGIRQDSLSKSAPDPFSPYSMIPLPSPFGSVFDASFIRRRNERERDRVRCVNDGYLRLKEHLPLDNKDKRLSKVETLRGAIDYIKHLQSILDKASDTKNKGDAKKNCETVKTELAGEVETFCNDTIDNESDRCSSNIHVSHELNNGVPNGNMNSLQAHTTMRPN